MTAEATFNEKLLEVRKPFLEKVSGRRRQNNFITGWFILFVLCTSFIFPGKIVPLPGHLNPKAVYADGDQIYITEETSIYIYGREDFKLRKKFGREGEGPQEFKGFASLKDKIFVIGHEDFIIGVFDENGDKLFDITQNFVHFESTAASFNTNAGGWGSPAKNFPLLP